jgi:hypothetical protein
VSSGPSGSTSPARGGMWEISVGRLADPARVRGYREVSGD